MVTQPVEMNGKKKKRTRTSLENDENMEDHSIPYEKDGLSLPNNLSKSIHF